MKYIPLTSVLLALLLVLTVNAYATTADTGPTAEDIPEWALRPALEPDEEPTADNTDTTEAETKQEYTTIYDTDGSILYTDDPALVDMVKATTSTPSRRVCCSCSSCWASCSCYGTL